MRISIHNTTEADKTTDEWIRNDDYRGASWRNFAFAKDFALDLFKDKLTKVPFKDEVLTKQETEKLKKLLESKIRELLLERVPEPDYRTKIYFLEQTFELNSTPFGKNDQDGWIIDFFRAYQVCEECLQESKPVYLSIIEDE